MRIQTNSRESRTNLHQNARLTPRGRELLVKRVIVDGLRPIKAAQAAGVSPPTAYKWLCRYRRAGWDGLQDRSSRPRRSPRSTPERLIKEIIERRKNLPDYLKRVGKGEGFVITSRGRAVERIVREHGRQALALARLKTLRGTAIAGDILAPLDEQAWHADEDSM